MELGHFIWIVLGILLVLAAVVLAMAAGMPDDVVCIDEEGAPWARDTDDGSVV